MEQLIIIGGGGHARVIIDLLRCAAVYEIVGIVDHGFPEGRRQHGCAVLGGDAVLPSLRRRGIALAALGVASVRDNAPRERVAERVRSEGFSFPSLVHPNAVVSRDAVLADGVQVMAGAVIQSGARIGGGAIVNTRAGVDHDCTIGQFVHVSVGATLSGDVTVGDGAFIGAGAVVKQGIRIGAHAIVAAGAVVIRDVPDGATVMGVPARSHVRIPASAVTSV